MPDRIRTAAAACLLAVACGPLLGTAWWLLAPRVEFVLGEDGTLSGATDSAVDWFGAEGWFLLLGAALGLVVGVVACLRWHRRPVSALLGTTVGLLLAAVMAWWLGGLLGPGEVSDQLAGTVLGDLVGQPLGLRATGSLLIPAIVGVASFGAMALATPAAPGTGLAAAVPSRDL